MLIKITLNGNSYGIDVDGNCYTAISYGIVSSGTRIGQINEKSLGFFNKLPNAALRLCREEISSSPDIVTLKEFASRVEAINKQLLDQLDLQIA